MEVTTQSFNNLVQKINEFEIAEGYFSDILNSQAIIFGVIVTIIIVLSAYLTLKDTKRLIRKQLKKITERDKKIMESKIKENKSLIEKQKEETLTEIKMKYEMLDKKIDNNFVRTKKDINYSYGEIYRTMGIFWGSKQWHATSFLWHIRAAYRFYLSGEQNLVRVALEKAKKSLDNIKDGALLSYDIKGEYQQILEEIPDNFYRIEREALDKAFKEALERKPVAK